MLWNSLQLVSSLMRQRLSMFLYRPGSAPAFVPQLAGMDMGAMTNHENNTHETNDNPWIWFAVPKRKVTPSRKRMKTTIQKRLPLKKNIIFDPRTGEVTLMHKLPFNWKDYLPKTDATTTEERPK
mmetsp:Transcript_88433/g.172950  ORF Transcript_88433/g.172950 Transcript_88433/m.172950 type:complete len:125 (-) Transcript_88433:41-415(-)